MSHTGSVCLCFLQGMQTRLMLVCLCAHLVCHLFRYCLELMSRLRAGPEEVSGFSASCRAVCFSGVSGEVPVTGQISICSVSRFPPRRPQQKNGAAHGPRHPALFPSPTSRWGCVWVFVRPPVFYLGECPCAGDIRCQFCWPFKFCLLFGNLGVPFPPSFGIVRPRHCFFSFFLLSLSLSLFLLLSLSLYASQVLDTPTSV